MVNPFAIERVNSVSNVSLLCYDGCFQDILPAESILDQRHKDVREEFMQRVATEASLVSVCYAGKLMCL